MAFPSLGVITLMRKSKTRCRFGEGEELEEFGNGKEKQFIFSIIRPQQHIFKKIIKSIFP